LDFAKLRSNTFGCVGTLVDSRKEAMLDFELSDMRLIEAPGDLGCGLGLGG